MSTMTWPNHLLSLAEWNDLPEDNARRYELAEGILQVSPRPVWNHQRAIARLVGQLDSRLPADLVVLPEFELVLFDGSPATVRVPDVVVVRAEVGKTNPARVYAEDVLLVVEVISPGSRRLDRVLKLNEYAEAGIPGYWIVDLDPPVSLNAFRLVDDKYELGSEVGEVLRVSEPAPLDIDVRGLVN